MCGSGKDYDYKSLVKNEDSDISIVSFNRLIEQYIVALRNEVILHELIQNRIEDNNYGSDLDDDNE